MSANDFGFRPFGDRVVIRRHKADERSAGGIVIPENAREQMARGEVVATGPGKLSDDGSRRIEPATKRGETVIFGKYAGTELKVNGEDFVVVREEEILGAFAS